MDGDARLVREGLEQLLVMGREHRRPGGKRREDADEAPTDLERHAEHRPDALLLVDVPARRARIEPDVVDANGKAALGAAPDETFAERHRQGAPRIGLDAVSGGVDEVPAVLVQEPDAAAGAPDQRGDRAADGFQHRRRLQSLGDQAARPVQRRQLLVTSPSLFEEPALLDRGGQGPRELEEALDVALVEGPRLPRRHRDGAEHAPARRERHEDGRAVPPRAERLTTGDGDVSTRHVGDEDGGASGGDALE